MNNIEDEIGLRNLMARYVDAVNRHDEHAWIATWAPDGAWNLFGSEIRGRDAILATWRQAMAGFEFALLLPSSCLFDVSGDSASGHWYLHEYNRDHHGNATAMISRYSDTYTKRDGQWLFQTRAYTVLAHGAADFSRFSSEALHRT